MEAGQGESTPAILVVSFGTSYNESRKLTIEAVERDVALAFPECQVSRAFTSPTIIKLLRDRDGIVVDNVAQALDRAAAAGIRNLVVQPTHLMDGFEYHGVVRQVEEHRELFDQITVGRPLLSGKEDFTAVARAVIDDTRKYSDGQSAMVFMGHGTEARSNQVYEKLQKTFGEEGSRHCYIGTVEAKPGIEDVAAALKKKGIYRKVVLSPLMLVAGDHANNDMAGDGKDSWKTVLVREGYETECRIRGLGELKAVRKIYVDHAEEALGLLCSPGEARKTGRICHRVPLPGNG
ncbi:MAG: sirohydrochlorin cobaltochelatase [Hungatella sp.]|nr:sirohydrochlorin cobaltochelatase [Hungatella sp.]